MGRVLDSRVDGRLKKHPKTFPEILSFTMLACVACVQPVCEVLPLGLCE